MENHGKSQINTNQTSQIIIDSHKSSFIIYKWANQRGSLKVILSIDDAIRLVDDVTELLRKEETLQRVQLQQVVVVGDLHGQFFDLLRIFDTTGTWVENG